MTSPPSPPQRLAFNSSSNFDSSSGLISTSRAFDRQATYGGVPRPSSGCGAYRAAQAALDEARAQVPIARHDLDNRRAELAEAIVAEARKGTRQVDLIRITGLSRERVRQILRLAVSSLTPDS
jgi:hypothetical protein